MNGKIDNNEGSFRVSSSGDYQQVLLIEFAWKYINSKVLLGQREIYFYYITDDNGLVWPCHYLFSLPRSSSHLFFI